MLHLNKLFEAVLQGAPVTEHCCSMVRGKDIKLKINVLQAVHVTLMAGQQVRDENCELFSSVWLWM